jgi:putative DNA primase/helicase
VFDGGRYQEIPAAELKALITEHLRNTDTKVTTHTMAAVLLCLNSMTMVRGTVEPGSWLDDVNGADVLVAQNGNVSFSDRDRDTGRPKLLRHSPSFFGLTKLPYDYDPEADCPLWRTFIEQIMSEDQEYVTLLQQWLGYLFRRDLHEHKFLLMVGEGSNGKGVFCDVVEHLVGRENISHVSLSLFGRPFSLFDTLGKIANITAESHHLIEESGESMLKSFVAGDSMSFERKFRDPVNATPTAKIMIATNSLPRFSDKTFGLWRRVLLVNFRETFTGSRQIKGLADELKRELPGILNWALAGLESLNAHNGFSIPAAHEAELEQYRRDADPCRAFLLERYTESANGEYIGCAEAYEAYRRWCETNGCRPMNERTFGQQVRRVFPNTDRTRLRFDGERAYVYKGLMESWPPVPICP